MIVKTHRVLLNKNLACQMLRSLKNKTILYQLILKKTLILSSIKEDPLSIRLSKVIMV